MGDQKFSVQRIAELQQLVANFAAIDRLINLADKNRAENDAEHSFGLALTCLFLAPKIAPELSLEKILTYSICHDIIEIHSGDTYIFDEARVASKPRREREALEQLTQEWPDFPEMIEAARGYMNKVDSEAIFVYTVDKMLPPIMINLGERAEYWQRNKITRQMHEENKSDKMRFSKELRGYDKKLHEWLANPDYFYKPEEEEEQ